MGKYINPLDFRKILVNYFLGSLELFIFAFIIIFSYVAAKYQMSNKIFLILLTIGAIFFANVLGELIYIFIILIVGIIINRGISKLMT